MKILFITYGELSNDGTTFRSLAMVRALAEAGHQISLIAARVDLPQHPNIRTLMGADPKLQSRQKLRMAVTKASGSLKFDVVHAVDDAALWALRICTIRRLPLIYDATRTFSGKAAQPPSKSWKWFPKWYSNNEKKLISRAAAILTPCPTLGIHLRTLMPAASLVQVEDVPIQSLIGSAVCERSALLSRFAEPTKSIAIVFVESASHSELRMLLMAARKVMDSVFGLSFVFRGVDVDEAQNMAVNLDIRGRCLFLGEKSSGIFVDMLNAAEASLFFPAKEQRYCEPVLFSLMNASAPVVAVQETAYRELLTEANNVSVLRTTDSIAEGLLRVIREPLFSLGLVTEANQLIADHYSLSSFKHKIRMVYHDVIDKA